MNRRVRLWYGLLVVPFAATLWPPFYAHRDPVVLGLPFFYWYQMLWVIITSLLVWLVLIMTKERDDV